MTKRERRLFERLVRELDRCSSELWTAHDDGQPGEGSWLGILRKDFRRWDRLLKAARAELAK